jgi:hypothetical protein
MIEGIPLVLWLTATTGPPPCDARCPCVVPAGVDWRSAEAMVPSARRDAYAIFVGTVVAVDTVARDSLWWPSDTAEWRRPMVRARTVRYRFIVDRTWKGPRSRELMVMDYHADTSCGRDYDLGGSYLVYADRDRRDGTRPGLSTYSCSRVLPKDKADADLRILGSGRAPRH